MKQLEFTLSNIEALLPKLNKRLIAKIFIGMSAGFVREKYKGGKHAELTDSLKNSIIVYKKSFYFNNERNLYCTVDFQKKRIVYQRHHKNDVYQFYIPESDPRHPDYVFKPKVKLIKKS